MADNTHREIEVFGRRLLLQHGADGWTAYDPGSDGKRRPARDVVIPAFIESDADLEQYLADLLHERARPDRNAIIWRR